MNSHLRMQTLGVYYNDNILLPIVFALETTEMLKWFTKVLRLASTILQLMNFRGNRFRYLYIFTTWEFATNATPSPTPPPAPLH